VDLTDTAEGEDADATAAVDSTAAVPPRATAVAAAAAATPPRKTAATTTAASGRAKRAASLAKRRLPPIRVLLVDDDSSVRDITARMLRRLGCSVDVLTDGYHVESYLRRAGDLDARSASSSATAESDSPSATGTAAPAGAAASGGMGGAPGPSRAHTYDCVFLDIVMPRLSGDVVARRLTSQLGFQVPLFACSGNAMPADLQRYRECGFSGVAAKPFSLKALKAKLFEVAGAKTAKASGMALAAGKTISTSNLSVLGPGPALSGLAESELFKQVIHHVLGDD
jgi:CheY-like chemotaxis protein